MCIWRVQACYLRTLPLQEGVSPRFVYGIFWLSRVTHVPVFVGWRILWSERALALVRDFAATSPSSWSFQSPVLGRYLVYTCVILALSPSNTSVIPKWYSGEVWRGWSCGGSPLVILSSLLPWSQLRFRIAKNHGMSTPSLLSVFGWCSCSSSLQVV